MLVAKDHVGGEESCWWEKIMLVVERGKCCRIMISVQKNTFLAQNGSPSVRLQRKSQQTICQLAADLILWGWWGQKIALCRISAQNIQRTFHTVFLNFSLNRTTTTTTTTLGCLLILPEGLRIAHGM